jgi:hypothetical protein
VGLREIKARTTEGIFDWAFLVVFGDITARQVNVQYQQTRGNKMVSRLTYSPARNLNTA